MITGPLPPVKPVLCVECAIKATVENAVQLHNHEGPAYDRWAKSMADAAARLNPDREV